MKKIVFVIFFICGISFSQNLEEAIYNATETFIHNKNNASFELLIQKETSFTSNVKTKDEQLAFVFLLCNKAFYLNEQSNLKEAIFAYEDALKRFNNYQLSTFSDFDIIESCLKPLGNLYIKTGDFTNAVSTINQYIFLARKNKNTSHQISGAINLAKLYQTIDNHEMVLKIVDAALELSKVKSNQKSLLQSVKTTSLIALNKYEEASILNQSDSKFENLKNNYTIAFQEGNYKEAFNSLKKAKEHLNKAPISPREMAKFYVEEGQLHFLLENKNDALFSLKQALKLLLPHFKNNGLPTKTDLYAENTFIAIFDLYATIQTNTENALKGYNLSFHVAELLEDQWTSQESKILNEANNRIRSEKCIELLLNTYHQTKDKSLLFKAFQYSEKNKASVLKSISHIKNRLKKYPNDSLLMKEYELIKTQEYYTSLLINEQIESNRAEAISVLSKQLMTVSLQLKTLKLKIEKKYPKDRNVFTLKTIQKKLAKDKAVLVEYFYGKNNIYQFVISEKDMIVESLQSTNETKQSIVNFIHLFDDASIINNDINNFTYQAFNIFKLLKFNTISNYKNLIIIPDGLLNFMPFEALLSSKTTTTLFEKMPFIIKNQSLVYNSSAQFYLTQRVPNKNNQLLGFFPVFKNSSQQLTYSINESHAIEEEMTSTIFMNAEASKKNFIKNASNYDILHLSTHASGGDFLTPAKLSFYDDTLYLNELYSLDLNSNLVVLSACETGIGTLYKGEGAMSLARGFQYAGAENLLFTLWQINDLSTSQIIQLFYQSYKDSESAFFANHQSKINYLENEAISNVKKSPYYWSSFVYYGTINPVKSNYNIFYIIIGVTIGILILYLLLKYKKHDRNTRRISSK